MSENWTPEIKPLTPTQLGIIKIVKAAIKSEPEVLPTDFDWDEAKKIIDVHEIHYLVYRGLQYSGISVPGWLYDTAISRVAFLTQLWRDAKSIMSAFTEKGIDFIPLKGLKVKELYPDRFMRTMSDVDIFVHENEYETIIRPLMLEMNFKQGPESYHEYHWSKGDREIELHKKFIPEYLLSYIQPADEYEWLNSTSLFVQVFVHFMKHFRVEGTGILAVLDLYLLWEPDKEAIFDALKIGKLYTNIRSLLDAWFEDKEFTEKDIFLTNYIFDSGKLGREERLESVRNITYSSKYSSPFIAKVSVYLKMIFPSRKNMSYKYPKLKRCAFLLPYYYVVRIIDIIFNKQQAIKQTVKKNNAISFSMVDIIKNEQKYIGIEI